METKTVLLTGAAGGMGRAALELLRRKGIRVIALDRVAPDCQDTDFFTADITDPEQLETVFRKLEDSGVHLDAIVNVAGLYDLNSLVEISEEDFVRIFNVNLFGMYRVNKVFLPLLKPDSRIIVVSSELAPLKALPFTGLYAVTKAAVEKYAESLRMELGLLGHSVSVVRPGAVRTGMLDVSQRRIEAFCRNTRLYGCNAQRFMAITRKVETANVEPERVAGVILRAIESRRPRYVYNINRSMLLRLFNLLPARLQTFVLRKVLG